MVLVSRSEWAGGPPHLTPSPRFATDLARFGDRTALVDEDDRSLTYATLATLVAARGEELGPERRLVSVLADHGLDTLVTYLAGLAGGHAVAMASSPEGLASTVERFDPDVVHDHRHAGLVERRPGAAHDLSPDLSLLLSTSGSTGSPKLVRLSADGLDANAASIVDYLGIGPDDRAITTLPLGYCYGLSVLHSHLSCGASVVLSDLSVVDACFWRRVREHGATSFAGVPFTFELLESVGFADMELPTLRTITQAGGRMDPDRVRRFARLGQDRGWRLFVMYGQTEATARMAYLPPELATQRPEAIGRAIPGGELHLDPVDGAGDGVGELVYRGPNVMLGYAEAPADLALGRTVTELRTGDLARRADDGLYEITGRASRFLKLLGLRIDLDRAEALLADHGIRALCTGDDTELVVGVERPGRAEDATDLLVRRLGLSRSLVTAVEVDDLPRLPTGKPDLVRLRTLAHLEREAVLDLRSDTPPLVTEPGLHSGVVASLYAEVLDVDRVGDDDTFVGLGGDSLSYIEITHELEPVMGTLPSGWHTLTVAELEGRMPTTPTPARRARPRADVTVVLRALAMVAVVATHLTVVSLEGGGHLLLGVAGYNTARFSLDVTGAGWLRQNLWRVGRVALPVVAYLAVFALFVPGIRLPTILLGSAYAADGTWRFRYWFIEALVQILLVVVVVLAIPAVRRAERRSPFWFAMAVVGLTVVLREVRLGPDTYTELQTHTVAWLFALGWLIHRADTTRRRVLASAVMVLALWGSFDDPSRELVIIAGLLLLTWWASLPVPSVLRGPLHRLAAASLAIYVVQWQVIDHVGGHVPDWIATVVALVAGCLVYAACVEGARQVRRRWPAIARARTLLRLDAADAPPPTPAAQAVPSIQEA